MLANFMAPQKLILRLDAQVMLIKNADENLVNGSVGRVVRFVDPAVYGTEFDEVNDEMSFSNSTVIGAGPQVGTAAKKRGASAGMVKLYPVVEFSLSNGGRRSCLVLPEVWKVELPNGDVQVSRTQASFYCPPGVQVD
jgi:ATP-dependent DNA helicase PIF1